MSASCPRLSQEGSDLRRFRLFLCPSVDVGTTEINQGRGCLLCRSLFINYSFHLKYVSLASDPVRSVDRTSGCEGGPGAASLPVWSSGPQRAPCPPQGRSLVRNGGLGPEKLRLGHPMWAHSLGFVLPDSFAAAPHVAGVGRGPFSLLCLCSLDVPPLSCSSTGLHVVPPRRHCVTAGSPSVFLSPTCPFFPLRGAPILSHLEH